MHPWSNGRALRYERRLKYVGSNPTGCSIFEYSCTHFADGFAPTAINKLKIGVLKILGRGGNRHTQQNENLCFGNYGFKSHRPNQVLQVRQIVGCIRL